MSDRSTIPPLPGGAPLPVSTINCQIALELLVSLKNQDDLPPYDGPKVATAIKSLGDLFPHLVYYLDRIAPGPDASAADTKAALRCFYPFYSLYNEQIHLLTVYHITRLRRLLSIVNRLIDFPAGQLNVLSPLEQDALSQITDIRTSFYARENLLPTPRVTPPTSAFVDIMVVSSDIGEVLLGSGETVFLEYGSFHHLLRSDVNELLAQGKIVILAE